nr:riboflavin kinase [bacterium]
MLSQDFFDLRGGPPIVAVIGMCDGVHRGHRQLIEVQMALARAMYAQPVVITFTQSPRQVLTGRGPGLLTLPQDKQALIEVLGPRVKMIDFTLAFASLPWEEFLSQMVSRLHAVGIVCGQNHRFGAGGEGNAACLLEWARQHRLQVRVVPQAMHRGMPVSSSRIRLCVQRGDIPSATDMLGHAITWHGQVTHGRGIAGGRGVPTANLPLEEGRLMPPNGVYACRVDVAGQRGLAAVANLGIGPTLKDGRCRRLEVHLLEGEPGDLSGREMAVRPVAFLREEQPFASVDALFAQVRRDSARACEVLRQSAIR